MNLKAKDKQIKMNKVLFISTFVILITAFSYFDVGMKIIFCFFETLRLLGFYSRIKNIKSEKDVYIQKTIGEMNGYRSDEDEIEEAVFLAERMIGEEDSHKISYF